MSDDKSEYNFFRENGVPNTVLKSFPQKNPISADLNLKNWFLGHILPHICDSIGPIVFKK